MLNGYPGDLQGRFGRVTELEAQADKLFAGVMLLQVLKNATLIPKGIIGFSAVQVENLDLEIVTPNEHPYHNLYHKGRRCVLVNHQ